MADLWRASGLPKRKKSTKNENKRTEGCRHEKNKNNINNEQRGAETIKPKINEKTNQDPAETNNKLTFSFCVRFCRVLAGYWQAEVCVEFAACLRQVVRKVLLWSGQWQNVSRYCKFPVFSYYGPSQIFVLGSLASKSAPEVKNTLRASTKNPNICQQSLSKGRAGTWSIQPAAGTKTKNKILSRKHK